MDDFGGWSRADDMVVFMTDQAYRWNEGANKGLKFRDGALVVSDSSPEHMI